MRTFVLFAAIFGMIGVITGAFGAHALEGSVDSDMIDTWNTAVEYQMYHALALLGTAWVYDQTEATAATVAAWLFIGGIVVFSGSLYALVGSGVKWLGAITPIGGVSMIAGWIALAVAAYQL